MKPLQPCSSSMDPEISTGTQKTMAHTEASADAIIPLLLSNVHTQFLARSSLPAWKMRPLPN